MMVYVSSGTCTPQQSANRGVTAKASRLFAFFLSIEWIHVLDLDLDELYVSLQS